MEKKHIIVSGGSNGLSNSYLMALTRDTVLLISYELAMVHAKVDVLFKQ